MPIHQHLKRLLPVSPTPRALTQLQPLPLGFLIDGDIQPWDSVIPAHQTRCEPDISIAVFHQPVGQNGLQGPETGCFSRSPGFGNPCVELPYTRGTNGAQGTFTVTKVCHIPSSSFLYVRPSLLPCLYHTEELRRLMSWGRSL